MLESRLEVQVQQRALTWIDTTRQVHSEQTVHERCAHPCTTHRPPRMAPVTAVARPAQVVENRGANDRELPAQLPAPEPVRVSDLTRLREAWPLSANRVRAADEPLALRRQRPARGTRAPGHRCLEPAPEAARKRHVQRAACIVEGTRGRLRPRVRQQTPTGRV